MPTATIALVDADTAFLTELETLLQKEGYQTHSFADLVGTYDALCINPPDAAIIGLLFPENKHGIDLITLLKLRPETRTIPIIMTSLDLPFLTSCTKRVQEQVIPAVWPLARPIDQPQLITLLHESLKVAGTTD
ncbi:MAG: response regulator [Chloroflexota bacterium]